MATGTIAFDLDSIDFAMFDAPERPAGRLVRDGERRFAVRRVTSRGVITVAKAHTREQADHIAIPGLDIIEEVAA